MGRLCRLDGHDRAALDRSARRQPRQPEGHHQAPDERERRGDQEGELEARDERRVGGGPAWRRSEFVREVAIAARMASPRAPPNSRAVLTRPEASPASWGATPATALIVAGTKARPIPSAVNSDGNSIAPT